MTIREDLRGALANVLRNVSSYPEKVQTRLMGQNMGPLTEKVTDVALAVFEEQQKHTGTERTPEFEALEQELFKHQPVLSMQDGSVAGCQCMDRVFHVLTEDWGTHLAEVFEALGFGRPAVSESSAATVLAEVRSHAERWANRPPTSPYAMGLRDAWRTILRKIDNA